VFVEPDEGKERRPWAGHEVDSRRASKAPDATITVCYQRLPGAVQYAASFAASSLRLRTTMSSAKQEQLQRAIAQVTDRQPVPEIDFTQHTLDDGTSVNTQERVIKDVCFHLLVPYMFSSHNGPLRYKHQRCKSLQIPSFSRAKIQQSPTSHSSRTTFTARAE
jgi:hypothetical protein